MLGWIHEKMAIEELAPGGGTPPSFLDTMLSVERVKDNMWLAFIEKFLTNRMIGMNV